MSILLYLSYLLTCLFALGRELLLVIYFLLRLVYTLVRLLITSVVDLWPAPKIERSTPIIPHFNMS